MMDELLELRKDFADEAVEICNRTEEMILSTPESESFNSQVETIRKDILGSLHTIKGNSGFIGLDLLKSFTHQLEEIIKTNPTFVFRSELKTCFLDILDLIRNYCKTLTETDIFPENNAENLLQILSLLLLKNQTIESSNSNPADGQNENNNSYQADFDKVTVKYEDLDLLLNLTGDILLSNRSIFQQVKLKAKSSQLDGMVWSANKKLLSLQNKIIEIRSLPFSTLTKRYVRLVYDLSSSSTTPVLLEVKNEEALIDRTILEKIHEPLIHLIRNVFAHAIDSPEERAAKGKPESLTITLSCQDGSGSSAIELSDDGKGISVQKIKERALELGISIPENASEKEILNVIFTSDFSATQEANELSGRGIGLYVVQKTVQELGGRIELTTKYGYGSTFRMNIPNVFMLRDILVFEHSKILYGITRDKLKKIHPFSERQIHLVNKRPFITHENSIVEIMPLFDDDRITENDRYFIETKNETADSFGITASKIYGYQEVIVKSIDHLWGGQKNIAGVAQTDSGEMALIVDVYQLASEGIKREEKAKQN